MLKSKDFFAVALRLCLVFIVLIGVKIIGGCANTGSSDLPAVPINTRLITFINLCEKQIYVAASGNNDPSGSEKVTDTCTFPTPVDSPCRCTSDTHCRANEFCGQVPNRTADVCNSDADCKTAEGQYCDKTYDPPNPRCSFRFCSYVPADPNNLSMEVSPEKDCTSNSACAGGEYCNTMSNTCYHLPSDGGNGWIMAAKGDPVTLTFPEPWAGRFWARTGCDEKTFICDTGQCNGCMKDGQHLPGLCTAMNLPTSLHCAISGLNPATLAELNMQVAAKGDFYDISNVDSGNVGIEIRPDSDDYDVNTNEQAKSDRECQEDSDCVGLFGAFIWKCDQDQDPPVCINPFTCGNPGCVEMIQVPFISCAENSDCLEGQYCNKDTNTCWFGCAANGIGPNLLQGCLWGGEGEDDAIPEVDCQEPLKVMKNGQYVGCNAPKIACTSPNPPAPGALDCSGTALALYGCTGANAQSCFSKDAGGNANCCGCPQWAEDSAPGSCVSTNPTWTSEVQPLIESFNTACPTSYSFPFDDAIKLFTCQKSDPDQGIDYTITFCPNRSANPLLAK